MPPKYLESGFMFVDGDPMVRHEEGIPYSLKRDMGKWALEGFDTFDGEIYDLAIDIDTEEDAELLATARLRQLEVNQPTIDTGGQSREGLQDQVYIIPPDCKVGGRFNPPRAELFGNSPEKP